MLGRYIDLGNPVAEHPLNKGLVSWWVGIPPTFGGASVLDLTFSHNNATLTNTSSPGTLTSGWVPSRDGFWGVALDGTDDWLNPGSLTTTSVGSFGMWFCPATTINTTTNTGLFVNGDTTLLSASTTIIWRWDDGSPAGALRLYLYDGVSFVSVDTTTTTWTAGQWYYVLQTWNGSKHFVYVNGLLQNSANVGSPAIPDPVRDWRIGAGANGTTFRYFNGTVGSAILYNRALSDAEALQLYDQTNRGYPDMLRRFTRKNNLFASVVAAAGRVCRPSPLDGLGGVGQKRFNPSLGI